MSLQAALNKLAIMFTLADEDRDNALNEQEFCKAFSEITAHLSTEEKSELFFRVDIDSNGFVEFEEFIDFFVLDIDAWGIYFFDFGRV